MIIEVDISSQVFQYFEIIKMKFFAVFAAILALGAATTMTTTWTIQELEAALANPNTDPALIPYLEHAVYEYLHAFWNGQPIDSIVVPLPAEVLLPIAPEVVGPAEVLLPIAPAPASPVFSSPLVQVIVNVNKKTQQVTDVPAQIIVPSPVAVVPSPELEVETGALEPETPVLPVDSFNPIDTIAINPEPINVNIIDPSPAVDIGPM
ncbi:unnamed protein product [Leptidea sinapis]|uniref:Uncharacterized protein n=2 Tax=Leptidea sinapis TaxID=189913 RepID=A0A5E4QXD6_9NEOP|nr:unnamed protein product [Leptidea sinapis]